MSSSVNDQRYKILKGNLDTIRHIQEQKKLEWSERIKKILINYKEEEKGVYQYYTNISQQYKTKLISIHNDQKKRHCEKLDVIHMKLNAANEKFDQLKGLELNKSSLEVENLAKEFKEILEDVLSKIAVLLFYEERNYESVQSGCISNTKLLITEFNIIKDKVECHCEKAKQSFSESIINNNIIKIQNVLNQYDIRTINSQCYDEIVATLNPNFLDAETKVALADFFTPLQPISFSDEIQTVFKDIQEQHQYIVKECSLLRLKIKTQIVDKATVIKLWRERALTNIQHQREQYILQICEQFDKDLNIIENQQQRQRRDISEQFKSALDELKEKQQLRYLEISEQYNAKLITIKNKQEYKMAELKAIIEKYNNNNNNNSNIFQEIKTIKLDDKELYGITHVFNKNATTLLVTEMKNIAQDVQNLCNSTKQNWDATIKKGEEKIYSLVRDYETKVNLQQNEYERQAYKVICNITLQQTKTSEKLLNYIYEKKNVIRQRNSLLLILNKKDLLDAEIINTITNTIVNFSFLNYKKFPAKIQTTLDAIQEYHQSIVGECLFMQNIIKEKKNRQWHHNDDDDDNNKNVDTKLQNECIINDKSPTNRNTKDDTTISVSRRPLPIIVQLKCKRGGEGGISPNFDIYIGNTKRGKGFYLQKNFIWSNRVGSLRKYSEKKKCGMYAKYLFRRMNQNLMDKIIKELEGKRLGCWCSDTTYCHGRVLIFIFDLIANKSVDMSQSINRQLLRLAQKFSHLTEK